MLHRQLSISSLRKDNMDSWSARSRASPRGRPLTPWRMRRKFLVDSAISFLLVETLLALVSPYPWPEGQGAGMGQRGACIGWTDGYPQPPSPQHTHRISPFLCLQSALHAADSLEARGIRIMLGQGSPHACLLLTLAHSVNETIQSESFLSTPCACPVGKGVSVGEMQMALAMRA